MAISLNGIIARENNEEDFLSHENWITLVDLAHKTGCMIWGRKTHELVKTWDKQYFEGIKGIRAVIVSTNLNYEVGEGFELASSPKEALEKLKKEGFSTAMLTGGATLNSSFAKLGLIDEIILNIEPVVVGKGIPLFFPKQFDLNLQLLKTKRLKNNILQLHYKVKK